MRKSLSKCKPCCPPCPSDDLGCNGVFFATGGFQASEPIIIGNVSFPNLRTGSSESCLSQRDAENKADYQAAQRCALVLQGRIANFSTWSSTWDNDEISWTANCRCGTTGDPVTVTISEDTFTDFWTPAEANFNAQQEAISQAEDLLECITPDE